MFALRTSLRKFSTSVIRAAGKAHDAAAGGDHHANPTLWKNLTLFVALPAIAVCTANAWVHEKEHLAHPEHARPPFVAYEYLRRRTKPFPWGDGNHTLFHNPKKNALPEGYEWNPPEGSEEHGHH